MVKVVTAGREWNGRTKDKRKSTEETKSATLFSSSCCFMWSAMNLTPMTACITFDGRILGRRRLIDGSSSSLRTASPLPSDLTDDCCHHRIHMVTVYVRSCVSRPPCRLSVFCSLDGFTCIVFSCLIPLTSKKPDTHKTDRIIISVTGYTWRMYREQSSKDSTSKQRRRWIIKNITK